MKLQGKALDKFVNESVKRTLNEINGNDSLEDAIELLVNAHENISSTIKDKPELKYDLSISLNGIKNAVRIIRNNLYN